MLLPLAFAMMAMPSQPCPTTPAALPAVLSGWRDTAAAPGVGKAFVVRGQAPASVRGLSASEVARGGSAALVPIEIDRDGVYRIALSDGAWIDMMAGTTTLASIAHAHAPACSGIDKIVDFRLQRGRYALHLSGMKAATLRILIARA